MPSSGASSGADALSQRPHEVHDILHCRFDGIPDPTSLDAKLLTRAGVVGTGLFLGMTDAVIIGRPGGVEVREA